MTAFEAASIEHAREALPGLEKSACNVRYILVLLASIALPLVVFLIFMAVIDPYYLFGSPNIAGVNSARPAYEAHVVVVKPYQLRRVRPEAIILGSSRAEAGLDPNHPGWGNARVFNFGIPGAGQHDVTLAFLHALEVAPIKRAVIGLDLFGYNTFRRVGNDYAEYRLAGEPAAAFLAAIGDANGSYHGGERPAAAPASEAWDDALYLALNADVANAVAAGQFANGRAHYDAAGQAEGRRSGFPPSNWNEGRYLEVNADVAVAVRNGQFASGYHHFLMAGKAEGRLGGLMPADWDEEGYLAANPDAVAAVAMGTYDSGFAHYGARGRWEGRLGGRAPASAGEWLRWYFPTLNRTMFQVQQIWAHVFSATALSDAITTVRTEGAPSTFGEQGQRLWKGQDEAMRQTGGVGAQYRGSLSNSGWRMWYNNPLRQFCFDQTGARANRFDSFRVMVRAAYERGVDLRMFISPLHVSVRLMTDALLLDDREQYWLRELVRINEEEAARAGRPPLPLWDFGPPGPLLEEPIPPAGEATMRYFWDTSHYRQSLGNLILDRVLGHDEPGRDLPPGFGVRLTGEVMTAYQEKVAASKRRWLADHPEVGDLLKNLARLPVHSQAEAKCW